MDEDYDALNEQTFGSAINDDWEGEHENLVLLDSNGNTSGREKDETDDGDLGDLGKTRNKLLLKYIRKNSNNITFSQWFVTSIEQ